MKLRIKKDVLFPAPEKPEGRESCWALDHSYTSSRGRGMIMTTVRFVLGKRPGDEHDDVNPCGGGAVWSTAQRMISEDNGATWAAHGPAVPSMGSSLAPVGQNLGWNHFLDRDKERLIAVYQITRPEPDDASGIFFLHSERTTLHYEISTDKGKSWGPSRQIIHPGGGCDETHWMPGITGNKQWISACQAPLAKLDDGTIVFGCTLVHVAPNYPAESHESVVFLRGRWSDDLSGISWEAGDVICAPLNVSGGGVCEPDLLHLGGQRLLTTMRCEGLEYGYFPEGERLRKELLRKQGIENEGNIFSSRQWSLSEDGGRTWSIPQTLRYDDGSVVHVPSSIAAFEKDLRTGKAYWFANILDKPVMHQMPRHPLTISELDTERICIIKESVSVIQDLPKGAPAGRRYCNFGHYYDRETGEFVLMLAEEPKFSAEDFRADTIRFRIALDS